MNWPDGQRSVPLGGRDVLRTLVSKITQGAYFWLRIFQAMVAPIMVAPIEEGEIKKDYMVYYFPRLTNLSLGGW